LFERLLASQPQRFIGALLALGRQRIIAVEQHALGVAPLGPGLRQADEVARTEPHIVRLAEALITEDPSTCLPFRYLQVHAIADAIASLLLQFRDGCG
jgi:hypothetical protein